MREQAYYRYLPLASRWRFQLLVGSIWHICGWMCSRYAYQLCDHPSNGKQDKGCHQLRHIQNQHRGNCMVLSCIALRVLSCCSMGRFLGTPKSSTCREAQADSATFSSAKHLISPSSCLQVGQRLCTLALHVEHNVCPFWHCKCNQVCEINIRMPNAISIWEQHLKTESFKH